MCKNRVRKTVAAPICSYTCGRFGDNLYQSFLSTVFQIAHITFRCAADTEKQVRMAAVSQIDCNCVFNCCSSARSTGASASFAFCTDNNTIGTIPFRFQQCTELLFFSFCQFGRKAEPAVAAGHYQISAGQIQITRDSRCFRLDTLPCYLHQKFISLYQSGRWDFFANTGAAFSSME